MRRFLVVGRRFPDPPRDGVDLPVLHTVRALERLGEVDFVAAGPAPTHAPGVHAIRVRRGPWKRRLGAELALAPSFTSDRVDEGDLADVAGRLSGKEYDWAWVSPVPLMPVLDELRAAGVSVGRVGVGLNDLKTGMYVDSLHEVLSGRYGWDAFRVSRGLRVPGMLRWERRVLRRADLVHVQTELEAEKVARWIGVNPPVLVSGNGFKAELMAQPARPPSQTFLLVSNFAGYRRNESRWFLREVWPTLRAARPGWKLLVVGAVDAQTKKALEAAHPGVSVAGFVEDYARLLAEVSVMAIPSHHSTGLNNRLLDGLAAGVPLAITPQVAGTLPSCRGSVGVRVCASRDDFVRAMLEYSEGGEGRGQWREENRGIAREHGGWDRFESDIVHALQES